MRYCSGQGASLKAGSAGECVELNSPDPFSTRSTLYCGVVYRSRVPGPLSGERKPNEFPLEVTTIAWDTVRHAYKEAQILR